MNLARPRIDGDVGDAALHDAPFAPFDLAVRVYYEDTDAGGVVYYANYLKFFERASTDWLRSMGVTQQTLRETAGLMFVVASAAIDYHAPARLDDLVLIRTRIGKPGRVALTFLQEAWRQPAHDVTAAMDGAVPAGELLARGHIKVGCVDAATMRPAAIPGALRERLLRAP